MVQTKITENTLDPAINRLCSRWLDLSGKRLRTEIKNVVTTSKFKGVSSKSIANYSSTNHTVNPASLELKIEPLISTFKINAEGFEKDQYYSYNKKKSYKMSNDLRKWVRDKYNAQNKEQVLSGKQVLRVRSKYNTSTYHVPPLGDSRRYFFNIAYKNWKQDQITKGILEF